MKTAALIVAAGKGVRTGAELPKQYAKLGGKALVRHCAERFAAHPAITGIFIVIGEGQDAMLAEALGETPVAGVVTGGTERQDSVRAGLAAIERSGGYDAVLIHDAARPLIPAEVIDALISALVSADGAIPALDVVDTLAKSDGGLGENGLGGVVDRAGLVRVQTPQAFRMHAIVDAHARWAGGPATDDAQMARAAGKSVQIVAGSAFLDKITHPGDLKRMESHMNARLISRTGMGYDVHRLEAGEELWLCGIKLNHHSGLSGHSDADVAIHALVDALLGAAALGDIGTHFPPSDPQWKGADSSRFLTHARDLVVALGGTIDNIDLTIICEAPKIGPHRDEMRARLALLLQVQESQISIKATTTERLGFTGREEGIAAQAVATIRMEMI